MYILTLNHTFYTTQSLFSKKKIYSTTLQRIAMIYFFKIRHKTAVEKLITFNAFQVNHTIR